MKRFGSFILTVWLTAAIGLIVCASGQKAAAQSVWELTPYRIRLVVAFSPSPVLTPQLASELNKRLTEQIDTSVGIRWDVKVLEPSPPLRHRMIEDIESVKLTDLPKDTSEFDKVFLVTVAAETSHLVVEAREIDVRTETYGPVVRLPVWQTAKLCNMIFQSLIDIFTPIAQVAKTTGDEVTLRLRAGELPPRDSSLPVVGPGDVFQPLMRYSNRQGELTKKKIIDWTYLLVKQRDEKGVQCAIHSAMPCPMSGRRRGRVEALALYVHPSNKTTRLVLRAREEPKPRLSGYQVYEKKIDGKETKLIGRTDIDGAIEIGPGEQQLRILLVKSGKVLLAKLPVVPGFEPEVSANIRNDDQRLEAEGFITAMQLNMIDMLMRRDIMVERAKVYLKSNQLEKAEKIVRELQEMPTRETLLRELGNKQERIVVEDTWMKGKVDELFTETRKLIKKRFTFDADKDPIKVIARQVAEARKKALSKSK